MHQRLLEIPSQIESVARRSLTKPAEYFCFLMLVDSMRYHASHARNVSTAVLSQAFGDRGRKRIVACLKECVEEGFMFCCHSYVPAVRGSLARSKRYGIAASLLASAQHRDGLGGCLARCVAPFYYKCGAEQLVQHRDSIDAAMRVLGWDCVATDVVDEVRPALVALECPWSDADVVAFFHAQPPRRKRPKNVRRFDKKTGVCYYEEVTIDDTIRYAQKCLREIATGNIRAFRKDGRQYHSATALPSEARRYCQFRMPDGSRQRAVDVDISACYLSILVSMLPECSEKLRLVAACERGEAYEEIRAGCVQAAGAADVLGDKERDGPVSAAFKRSFNCFLLFTSPIRKHQRPGLLKAFSQAFPLLAGLIRNLHELYTPRQISFRLTRIEGKITLDRVLPVFQRHGIPCLAYHDGVLLPEEYAETACELYRKTLWQVLGFCPLVKIKTPPLSSEQVEEMYC